MAAGQERPLSAFRGTSPGGGSKGASRRGGKNEITVVGFMLQPDGSAKPFDELTEAEKAAWRESCCRRLSERMSDYFTQHPEEYAKF